MTPGSGVTLITFDARIVAAADSLRSAPAARFAGRRLDRGDQFEIILQAFDRRHEHVEPPVARFDRQRRPHRAADVAEALLDALLARLGGRKGRHRLRAALRSGEIRQRPGRRGRIGKENIRI